LDKFLTLFEQLNFLDEHGMRKEYYHTFTGADEAERVVIEAAKQLNRITHSKRTQNALRGELAYYTERDALIAETERKNAKTLAEQEAMMAEQEAMMAEQATALAEQAKTLAQKDTVLAEQASALAQKDQLIAKMQAELEKLKK
jgi:hypothetical protein